jgi:hypothetical protein
MTRTIRYNGCKIERSWIDVALMACNDDTNWDNVVQLYSHDLVTDVAKTTETDTGGNLTSCKVVKTKKPFCLFEASPTPDTTDVFAATKLAGVVTSVYEDVDGCVKQLQQEVWVVCAGSEYDGPDVFCTTDECP